MPPDSELGTWRTFLSAQTLNDVPAGTDPATAARVIGGLPVTHNFVDDGRTTHILYGPSCNVTLRPDGEFEVIEEAWKQHGGVYIDFKIECGFDRETGDLLVADVIDSDSGRLRFGDVDMSKQSYRDGTATLPEIKKKFDDVAALTDRFV